MFQNLFNTIYVHVLKDAFLLQHVQEDRSLRVVAEMPFSSTRLAVGNFTVAGEVLSKGLKELKSTKFGLLAPIIVMHPKHLCEGGLSQIEKRAISEVARAAGAKEVYVWEGANLSREQLLKGEYKTN